MKKEEKLPSEYQKEFGLKKKLEWLNSHNDRDYEIKASEVARINAELIFLAKQVDNIFTFVNEKCVKKSTKKTNKKK